MAASSSGDVLRTTRTSLYAYFLGIVEDAGLDNSSLIFVSNFTIDKLL